MADFTIDTITDIDGYDPDIWGTACNFGWWCLGHNFDIVGALMSMASLSWEQGFESGRTISTLCNPIEPNQLAGAGFVHLRKDSGD